MFANLLLFWHGHGHRFGPQPDPHRATMFAAGPDPAGGLMTLRTTTATGVDPYRSTMAIRPGTGPDPYRSTLNHVDPE